MFNETAFFTPRIIPDALAAIFTWSRGERHTGPMYEERSSPNIRHAGLDRAVTVASDPDVLRIENMLTNILLRTEALLRQEEAVVVPEVFQLQPLTRRRVTVNITSVKAAVFQFVAEDESAIDGDDL